MANETESKTRQGAGTKRPARRKPKSKKRKGWISNHPIATLCAGLAALTAVIFLAFFGFSDYSGKPFWIYVGPEATNASLRDSLKTHMGMIGGNRAYLLWRVAGGKISSARGKYLIEEGTTAMTISRRLRSGAQTPVKVAFRGERTFDRVARRIASQMEFSDSAFLAACDSLLPAEGFTPEQYPSAFFPDTYEFYITASPESVVKRLLDYRQKFWTPERRQRAAQLGLTPESAATLASIVEEESAKSDERPKIARLYLNRLHKGMRLQADPTVKFATGDFALRRITGRHLQTPSAYNTYLNDGLPPGPIRMPERRTVEGVLDAPQHDYLYMCAREDFSGYHRFATDYAEHLRNARRYQAELNRRNIH